MTCWPAVQLSGLARMFHCSCPGVFVTESVSTVKVRLPSCKIVRSGSAGLTLMVKSSVRVVFPSSVAFLNS